MSAQPLPERGLLFDRDFLSAVNSEHYVTSRWRGIDAELSQKLSLDASTEFDFTVAVSPSILWSPAFEIIVTTESEKWKSDPLEFTFFFDDYNRDELEHAREFVATKLSWDLVGKMDREFELCRLVMENSAFYVIDFDNHGNSGKCCGNPDMLAYATYEGEPWFALWVPTDAGSGSTEFMAEFVDDRAVDFARPGSEVVVGKSARELYKAVRGSTGFKSEEPFFTFHVNAPKTGA